MPKPSPKTGARCATGPRGITAYPAFPAIFIRAPWVERVGAGVTVLARRDGHPVFVRAGHVMATSFHPELTADDRVHAYFLSLVEESRARTAA